jgi:hypothetical protein
VSAGRTAIGERKATVEDILSKMPEALARHITLLMRDCGFDTNDEARKKFIRNWLKKKAFFDKIIEHQGFHLVDRIDPEFRDGVIILTYSGSILTLSPETDEGTREIVYNSIEMRKDVATKTEDRASKILYPIELHKPLLTSAGTIKKTSSVLSMAIEEVPGSEADGIGKRLRIIGERISRTLLLVNKELFSKHSEASDLDDRDDLFDKWIILTWFRIGGWEEAVFYARARMLWIELFSRSYNRLAEKIKHVATRDDAFLSLSNGYFTKFIDDYKWFESEKKNFDIGLMKALEEIPGRKDYDTFMEGKLAELARG